MKRRAFPPAAFAAALPSHMGHPGALLLTFAALSLAIGLAWTPPRLLPPAIALGFILLLPRPSGRPWLVFLRFGPLLLLVPVLHVFVWRGFEGSWRLPWSYDASAWSQGLLSAARMGLWILLSARTLERLHPASLMARLPRSPRLARWALSPVLALAWLDLMLREAWILERSWRARGGRSGLWAHWPSLLLPLFRKLLIRADTLGEALSLRRFPSRWAGRPSEPLAAGDLLALLPALIALTLMLYAQRGAL